MAAVFPPTLYFCRIYFPEKIQDHILWNPGIADKKGAVKQ